MEFGSKTYFIARQLLTQLQVQVLRQTNSESDHGVSGICKTGGRKNRCTTNVRITGPKQAEVSIDNAITRVDSHSGAAAMVKIICDDVGYFFSK